MKYSSLDLAIMEAVFNKLGGREGVCAFLRDEQRLAPVAFARNKHNHIVITLEGLGLTGSEEVDRLIGAGVYLDRWAQSCLLSKTKDSYDKNHRLAFGMQYKIVLMPTCELDDTDRTTSTLCERGFRKYGYVKPIGGLVPHICLSVSDKQMEDIGALFIVVPHDPIIDSDGDPRVLSARRGGGGPWLDVGRDHPAYRWRDYGAFAFLVPAS